MAEGIVNDNAQVGTPADGGQVTQPATGTVVPNDGDAPASIGGDSGAPDWQKEFQTPEELYAAHKKQVESYRHLQSVWTKDHGELLNLKKTGGAQSAPQTQGQSDPVLEALNTRLAPIQEKLAVFEMQTSLATLRDTNPDTYDQVAPMLQTVLEENPALWGSANPVETAYAIAEARMIKQSLPEIINRSKQRTQQSIADRQAAGGSGAARPVTHPATDPLADIAAGIVQAGRKGNSIFG